MGICSSMVDLPVPGAWLWSRNRMGKNGHAQSIGYLGLTLQKSHWNNWGYNRLTIRGMIHQVLSIHIWPSFGASSLHCGRQIDIGWPADHALMPQVCLEKDMLHKTLRRGKVMINYTLFWFSGFQMVLVVDNNNNHQVRVFLFQTVLVDKTNNQPFGFKVPFSQLFSGGRTPDLKANLHQPLKRQLPHTR